MSVYDCPCCGHLVLECVIISLKKIGRNNCNNPGGCTEPFTNFNVLVKETT